MKNPANPTNPGAEPIYVTRPYLPPLADLVPMLEQIWDSRVLTNGGPFHMRLEERLCDYLGVPAISLVTNGMLALTAAIDAAGIEGEVITTPYSFVATTHSVKIGKLEPVFVDVDPSDLNIDPEAIEAAITPRTSAIVAVHCYGNPCDVDAIKTIADRHGLQVIYDAAHAFGVRYRGEGLLQHGDFSTLSFHATKAFNTFEGGAVISSDAAGKAGVDRARNFGIVSEESIPAVGTNAKMSEFNAALGLLQLDHFSHVLEARAAVDRTYRELLDGTPGIQCLDIPKDVEPNFSYFPIMVRGRFPLSRDALFERMKAHGVMARRYFFPLLSSLPMYRDVPSAAAGNLPIATQAAEQVLCLPIYPGLTPDEQDYIVGLIRTAA